MSWRSRSTGRVSIQFPNDAAYVYIAWGMDSKRPLYIGKTRAYHKRMAGHERASKWWPFLRSIDLYAYRTEAEALIAESEAITELQPEYNQVGNAGAPPPLVRYLRHRAAQPPIDFGPPISTDEIPAHQLAIIARVQRRGRAA